MQLVKFYGGLYGVRKWVGWFRPKPVYLNITVMLGSKGAKEYWDDCTALLKYEEQYKCTKKFAIQAAELSKLTMKERCDAHIKIMEATNV